MTGTGKEGSNLFGFFFFIQFHLVIHESLKLLIFVSRHCICSVEKYYECTTTRFSCETFICYYLYSQHRFTEEWQTPYGRAASSHRTRTHEAGLHAWITFDDKINGTIRFALVMIRTIIVFRRWMGFRNCHFSTWRFYNDSLCNVLLW